MEKLIEKTEALYAKITRAIKTHNEVLKSYRAELTDIKREIDNIGKSKPKEPDEFIDALKNAFEVPMDLSDAYRALSKVFEGPMPKRADYIHNRCRERLKYIERLGFKKTAEFGQYAIWYNDNESSSVYVDNLLDWTDKEYTEWVGEIKKTIAHFRSHHITRENAVFHNPFEIHAAKGYRFIVDENNIIKVKPIKS